MANLTYGVPLKPYGGPEQRRTYLPIAANAQLWQGSFLVQGSGALVVATTSGDTSTIVVGISEYDILGGASNGAIRASVLNGREFSTSPGGNTPPTDATPYGTALYADTDNTCGTVNTGSALPKVGNFTGMEPDAVHFRVFIAGW